MKPRGFLWSVASLLKVGRSTTGKRSIALSGRLSGGRFGRRYRQMVNNLNYFRGWEAFEQRTLCGNCAGKLPAWGGRHPSPRINLKAVPQWVSLYCKSHGTGSLPGRNPGTPYGAPGGFGLPLLHVIFWRWEPAVGWACEGWRRLAEDGAVTSRPKNTIDTHARKNLRVSNPDTRSQLRPGS